MDAVAQPRTTAVSPIASTAVWGPGPLVMLADTDAGNVVTTAQAGAQWSYRPLLVLAPMLYRVQELTVRLGLHIGRGYGELIRERFGVGWAWLSTMGLAAAAIASLVTEFSGVAGVGELCGLSRGLTLPLAAALCSRSSPPAPIGGWSATPSSSVCSSSPSSPSLGRPTRAFPRLAKDAVNLPLGIRDVHVHGRGDHRLCVQSVDDLLPTVRHRRQKASTRPSDVAALGTAFGALLTQCLPARCWSREQRRCRARVGGPGQRRPNQRRAVAASRGKFWTHGVQRRRARRLYGGRHHLLVGPGLGDRRGHRLQTFPRISSVLGEMVLRCLRGRHCWFRRGRRFHPRTWCGSTSRRRFSTPSCCRW